MLEKYNRDLDDIKDFSFHSNISYIIKLLLESNGTRNAQYIANEVVRREKNYVRDNEKMPTPLETIGMLSLYFTDDDWDTFSSYLGACLGCFIDTDEEDAGRVFCDILIMANDDEVYGVFYEKAKLDLGFLLTYKLGGGKNGSTSSHTNG